MAKYPDGGPVFAVSIDCHMGTNSTGLVMKEGDEGRPVVTMVRPGGTAKNKVKVGDVCLATSFTELVNDPTNTTMKWGTPQTGWFDTEGGVLRRGHLRHGDQLHLPGHDHVQARVRLFERRSPHAKPGAVRHKL